jgi:hypothetical protein
MATITKGRTFVSGETVTPAKLNDVVDLATVTDIQTADIADGQITTVKIADSNVTGPKVQDGVSLQTVYSSTSTRTTIGAGHEIPEDNTKPQNTEGLEILTTTITPSSNTNKVLIQATINGASSSSTSVLMLALFKDSGADALAVASHAFPANSTAQCTICFLDSPATTSATTYKLRVGYKSGTGGFFINGTAPLFNGTWISWMTSTEIKSS